jgi:hypothetical protein
MVDQSRPREPVRNASEALETRGRETAGAPNWVRKCAGKTDQIEGSDLGKPPGTEFGHKIPREPGTFCTGPRATVPGQRTREQAGIIEGEGRRR